MMTQMDMNQEKQNASSLQYLDLYDQCRDMLFDHSVEVMNVVRDAACERFRQSGFPSKKVERYRYTDIAQLFAPDYGMNLRRLEIPVNPYDSFRCDVPNLSTSLYFVVNDMFYEKALPKTSLPEGVIVGSLARHANLVKDYYNRLASQKDDAVTDLNTMFAQDGLLIYVPKGVVVDKAIQVINILKAPAGGGRMAEASLMVNRRVLVVAEEGSEVTLLFCDHAADNQPFLTTQVTEVYAGERSEVNLYCLEETHYKNVRVSNVYVEQQRDSRLNHHVITLHNGVTRNMLNLTFRGEGASCSLGGCAISDKKQHVDNNTLIDHQVGGCTSHELYKYVLNDQSTGAFAGRVLVRKGAQKTSSDMRNQNLCATREARMYTQPMLEIYADDVKCSHGSTVGQLNEQALFYMRQRGISEAAARLLLQQAFVGEVIDNIRLEPLRDRLRYLVEKRFRGELNKCEGCKLCQ